MDKALSILFCLACGAASPSQADPQKPAVRLIMAIDRPIWKEASDGYTLLYYQDGLLSHEFGRHHKAVYVYGWQSKLVSIVYTNGTIITARYGEHGELAALESCRLQVIKFPYPAGQPVIPVSPTSARAAEFHNALAQLVAQPAALAATESNRTGPGPL